MSLKKQVADIIYEADWEIRGTINRRESDITDFYMLDEVDTVEAIIELIQSFDTTMRDENE